MQKGRLKYFYRCIFPCRLTRFLAWLEHFATSHALLIEADLLCGTVGVLDALRRGHRVAADEAVADEADVTRALRDVVGGLAVGVYVAGVVLDAGVVAVAVLVAGVGERALVVRPAADGRAADVGVALEALLAPAPGLVGLAVADGVGAAVVVHEADLDAAAAFAVTNLAVRALIVNLAADGPALDLRVTHCALGTLAYGPVALNEALGASAAVTGVLAEPIEAGLVSRAVVIWNREGLVGKEVFE